MPDRISLAQLRREVDRTDWWLAEDWPLSKDGILALIEAVEALNALMSGIDYCGEPASDTDIEAARAALARFDFGDAA